MDDFSFLVRLALMAPQHAQTLSADLPIASVFFPASKRLASDTVSEVKVSGTPPDVLFLKLETKGLLGNPLFHARPC